MMGGYILDFQDLDKAKLALAGGKGANLGELTRIEGIRVPAGFCISTDAFSKVTGSIETFDSLLDELAIQKANDRNAISEISGKIREVIEGVEIPEDISNEIITHLEELGETNAYAVRSSATAEDLPTASFAGQQDTYLNIIGKDAILDRVKKCWASLFTERAVVYRIQNAASAGESGHRKVRLAVVVQKMVFPQAAGILFTADPVTGNRKVVSIDAGFGLGEALVSGLVNADNYKVREGEIIDKKISGKKLGIYACHGGGTAKQEIEWSRQNEPALTDEQILQLSGIGRKIEAHFGSPQDIEWCLDDGTFYVVQSRPITTLFPIPQADDPENTDGSPHVYVSVGHQQMMTDAIKPLGLSFFLSLNPGRMRTAGGRLFVDVTENLASPISREILLNTTLGKSDPLMKDAFLNILARKDFIKLLPDDGMVTGEKNTPPPTLKPAYTEPTNAPEVVAELINQTETSIKDLKQRIQAKSGKELIHFILEDIEEWRKYLFDPRSYGILMTAINAVSWVNEKMNEWLGEKNAADTLSQSAPNNVTSEMGLALLDVADVIRPFLEVVHYLGNLANAGSELSDAKSLNALAQFDGGPQTLDAIHAFLEKYGMRCAGEIDITRTRWSENPAMLIPVILNNVKCFEHGAGNAKFEQGQREALKKEQELLNRLRQLPDGEQKAGETKRMIDVIRNLVGYREYPKYGMVSRAFVYRSALLREAERLVLDTVLREKEDIYYLDLKELAEVISAGKADHALIQKRKEDYEVYKKLTPPRVMTSDGEIITGSYKHEDLPPGAIAGLAVSSGVIEGRARVILSMENALADAADLEDGYILVTTFTDPSWTPLFVSIKGLVTEVGGLMTHGAVIAREYGLPAVVGVEHATRLIKDGQRIRVNGTDGYVELID